MQYSGTLCSSMHTYPSCTPVCGAYVAGPSLSKMVSEVMACMLASWCLLNNRHPNCPAASGEAVPYDAKHPEVMARLPPILAAQLSIVFTQSGAMDDDMLQHIHHDVMKGLSIQAVCYGTTLTRLSWITFRFGPVCSSLGPIRSFTTVWSTSPIWGPWQCRPLNTLQIMQPIWEPTWESGS